MDWEEIYNESTQEFERRFAELNIAISKYDPVALITSLTAFYYYSLDNNSVAPGHLEYFCGRVISSNSYGLEKNVSNEENANLLNTLKTLIDSWNFSNHSRKVKDVKSDSEFVKQMTMASLAETYVLEGGEINIQYLRNQLGDLYDPIRDVMLQDYGFTINDVIEILTTIQKIYEFKLNDFKRQLHQNASNVLAEIEQDMGKLESEAEISFKMDLLLGTFQNSDKSFMILTKEELLEQNDNITEMTFSAFIEKFSTDIGTENQSPFKYPTDDNIFRERPIIKTGEGIIVPSIQLLYWAITNVMEDEVIRNEQVKDKYLDHKGDYLENQVELILKDILPDAEFFNSLYYQFEENGESKRCELDHLIIYDSNILLIESKSGRLNKPARRGAYLSFKRNVEENIEKAFEQADRTRRYIYKEEIPVFTNKQGQTVLELEGKEKYTNIFLINATLDNFGEIATNLHELNDLNAYKYAEYPWSVNIYDLRKISKFIDFPTQFIHYIHRRIKVNNRVDMQSKIKSFNELNLFYNYLTENLYFDDNDEKQLLIIDNNGRDIINRVLMESPPRQLTEVSTFHKNKDFQNLIKEIESYGQFGFSNFILELMDLSSNARNDLVSIFLQIKQQSLLEANKGKIVEGILTTDGTKFKNEMGLHIISCDYTSLNIDNWTARAYLRAYEHKLQNFISIINYSDIEVETSFNYMLFISKEKAFEKDEELNKQLEKVKPTLSYKI